MQRSDVCHLNLGESRSMARTGSIPISCNNLGALRQEAVSNKYECTTDE